MRARIEAMFAVWAVFMIVTLAATALVEECEIGGLRRQLAEATAARGDFGAGSVAPADLADDERAADLLRVPVPPVDVELRFASPEQWFKIPEVWWLAAGVTWPMPRPGVPCRVTVPADGFEILARPRDGDAQWFDQSMATILAHEVLHCLRGFWHPTVVDPAREYAPLDDPAQAVGNRDAQQP